MIQFRFNYFASFSGLSCMSANCDTLANEDFVLSHISMENVHVRDMYNQLSFRDYVRSHPQLRFCPGNNCKLIIKAVVRVAKRVVCTTCKSSFWYVLDLGRRKLQPFSKYGRLPLGFTCLCDAPVKMIHVLLKEN